MDETIRLYDVRRGMRLMLGNQSSSKKVRRYFRPIDLVQLIISLTWIQERRTGELIGGTNGWMPDLQTGEHHTANQIGFILS